MNNRKTHGNCAQYYYKIKRYRIILFFLFFAYFHKIYCKNDFVENAYTRSAVEWLLFITRVLFTIKKKTRPKPNACAHVPIKSHSETYL